MNNLLTCLGVIYEKCKFFLFIIGSLFLGYQTVAGPNENKLVDYILKANGSLNKFCEEGSIVTKNLRSEGGDLCDKSTSIAAFALLACGGVPNIPKDIQSFTSVQRTGKPKGSACYTKAKAKLIKEGFYDIGNIRILAGHLIDILKLNSAASSSLCDFTDNCAISDRCIDICIWK